jgi:Ca2+-binding RTX toxin-like protein
MANIIGTTGPDTIGLDTVSDGVTGGTPTDGDDTITGLAGNDTLAGGLGADTFIFAPGHGQDVIDSDIAMGTEFEPGVDKIDLSAIRQISDYQDLTGYHLSDVGDSTTIDTDDTSGGFQGQNTITLESVQNEELTADDFIFTDDPLPTVTVRNASRSEGDSGTTELVFTVNSSAPATEVITVDWAVALNGTAKADDLAPGQVLSGTVTIPVGERSAQFTVGVQGDTNAEQNDTFTVQLSNAENAVILANNATAQGTIENDDGTPTVFSIQSELSQQEDDGVTASLDYTFDVFRLGDTSGTDTVDVLFLAGDTDADDFGGTLPPIVQTVTFEPGDKTQTVTVTIQDDFDREVDETFFLRLSNPNEGVIDTTFDTAVGTIVNDDDGPPVPTTYSIESLLTDLDEGNDGETTTWGFLIKRKGDDVSSAGQVEVVFDPGTTSADDFAGGALPESQFVSFDPGQKERLVTVEIAGDTLSELDETFILRLQTPSTGEIDPEKSSATGTIVNDDDGEAPPPEPEVSLSVDVASQAEGDTDTTKYVFTVSRTDDATQSAALVSFDQGTTDAADFGGTLPEDQPVFFDVGELTQDFTIEVTGDTDVEDNESFTYSITDVLQATIDQNASTATATIVNDDEEPAPEPPVISIAADASANQEEGDAGSKDFTFTVTRSGEDLSEESTVEVAFTAGDTDAADFDGGLPPTQKVTFAAGEETQPVTISVAGDTDVEDNETFTLTLQSASGATIDETGDTADGTIVNDDEEQPPEPPVISITADASANQEEGNDGATEFDFTVTRTGEDLSEESTVEVAFTAGDTDAADFDGGLPPTQRVTFAAGEETQPVTISVSGDTDVEPNESFTLTLQNATGATIDNTADTADGTIVNDDVEVPTGTFQGTNGDDDLPGTLGDDTIDGLDGDDFIFGNEGADTLDGGPGSDIVVGGDGDDLLISDEDGIKDYLSGGRGSNTFKFSGGNGRDEITDFTNGLDLIDLSAYSGVGFNDLDIRLTDSVVRITGYGGGGDEINLEGVDQRDVDESDFIFAGGNSIYISDVQLTEGDSGTTTDAVFTVSLSTPVGDTVTVDYATADGTATAGSDYTAVDGTLTFEPGETAQEVRVPITGDGAIEPNESFFVNLSNPVNDVIADGQGEATIVDDDGDALNAPGISADEVFDGTDGDDVLQGSDGDDALNGLEGDDVLSGRGGDDTLDGGAGDDILAGGSGDDTLDGGGDDDVLGGGSGNDELNGGAGNDSLAGGSGDDQLSGGAGNDTLIGGSGNDRFVFTAADEDSGQDTIRMFNAGEDTLAFEDYGERLDAFSDLDTNTNGVLDDGDANVSVDAGNTVIDLGGQTDGAIAGTLTLAGVTGLVADDMAFS